MTKTNDHFDPEFDKLSDQPVTVVGGSKSAAAWHPNSGPEVPHADLIARLRHMAEVTALPTIAEAADALAALGDTVPEEWQEGWTRAGEADAETDHARHERDEARAERDALAHVIMRVREAVVETEDGFLDTDDDALIAALDTTPAISLALHDAEVKAQALEEALEVLEDVDPDDMRDWLRARAAAIREEAN